MSENNQPINQYFIDQSEQVSISDLLFGIWDYKYFTIIIIILLKCICLFILLLPAKSIRKFYKARNVE